ncbi:MAG: hypothetical protein ACR2HC_02950 [Thermoleophilaceae bacterium]
MYAPRRILLVANRTATTERLEEAIAALASFGPAHLHLVVPATPRGMHRVVDPEVAGRAEAEAQLHAALDSFREIPGCRVSGEVGDADPIAAIQDALGAQAFDEIVVSTLPHRVSRWLRLDVISKARGLGLPVTHVEVEPMLEPARDAAANELVTPAAR